MTHIKGPGFESELLLMSLSMLVFYRYSKLPLFLGMYPSGEVNHEHVAPVICQI